MFHRIIGAAIGAGAGVGVLIGLLQHVALVPIILEAEKYENAAAGHRNAKASKPAEIGAMVAYSLTTEVQAQAPEHQVDAPTEEEDSPWRPVLTWIGTTLASVGFALVLVGAFAVSGRKVDAREGLLWGLGGFSAFALAPAFGLPPELPGAMAADLPFRQIWWIGAVAGTLAGLGLMVFARAAWAIPVGIGLLVLPHIVGAPHAHQGAGLVPPELAASFAARSLAVNAVFWALLGLATGALYARFCRAEAA